MEGGAGGARLSPLPEDEVHVHYLLPERIPDAVLAACEALLCPEERARRDRYVHAAGRRDHLLSRALVRTTLSRYAPVAPRDWRFAAGARGRPEIATQEHGWLRFNLSHTAGLLACAVARGREIGLDVEDTARPVEAVALAERCFAAAEVRALRALPAAAQQGRFFDYWTLKEAYIKARGMGLAIPLERFSFDLGPPIRIDIAPELADDPGTWQFARLLPTARHRMAAAVRRGAGPELAFLLKEVVPEGARLTVPGAR